MINQYDPTIEYAAIGAMLIDARCIDEAFEIVKPEDFVALYSQKTVEAIAELWQQGEKIDPVIVFDKAKAKINDAFYTHNFIAECMTVCGSAANIGEYCRAIKRASAERQFGEILDAASDCYGSMKAPELLQRLKTELDEIEQGLIATENEVVDSKTAVNEWVKYNEIVKADPESAYCKTGFKDLDNTLGGGMFNAGLYIVGARPGMGKTTLAINIAENIARRGKTVLFISLEMGKVQITAKRIALKTRLDYTKLMSGGYGGDEAETISRANAELANVPFLLSDTSLCRVSDIERMAKKISGLSCVVVDYFGLLTAEEGSATRSRYEDTTILSKSLKLLAKRLNIPLLLLSQLNRETNNRANKRPYLSDLRDTGALEQDADCVILLHREEYYKKDDPAYTPPAVESIELIVAKNRHGDTRVCPMLWDGKTGAINELSPRADEPQAYSKTFTYYNEDDELPF